jgi:hypothetical protein
MLRHLVAGIMFLKYVLIRVFFVAHWRGTCHEDFFILGKGGRRVVVGRCGLLNLSLARGVVGEVLWEGRWNQRYMYCELILWETASSKMVQVSCNTHLGNSDCMMKGTRLPATNHKKR